MVRKQGAARPTKLRHVHSHPTSSHIPSSNTFSATAVRAKKTKDAEARNFEYAGAFTCL